MTRKPLEAENRHELANGEEDLSQKYLVAIAAANYADEERVRQLALAESYKKIMIIISDDYSADIIRFTRKLFSGKHANTRRSLRSKRSPERGKPRLHTHEPLTETVILADGTSALITYSKLTLERRKFRQEEVILEKPGLEIRLTREYEGRDVLTKFQMIDEIAHQYLGGGVPTILPKPGHKSNEAPDILNTIGKVLVAAKIRPASIAATK